MDPHGKLLHAPRIALGDPEQEAAECDLLARLRQVKERYDPAGVLRDNFSVLGPRPAPGAG